MVRTAAVLTGLALLIGAAPLTAQTAKTPSLVGTWTAEDAETKAAVEFRKDGTFTRTVTTGGKTQVDKGTYRIHGDIILIEPEGEDEVVAVKFKLLTPEKLHLTIPEEGAVTMQRAKAEPVGPVKVAYTPPDPPLEGVALYPICIHGRYGYIDATGKVRIRPQFELATEFQDDRAAVTLKDEFGYLAGSGKLVVPCRYDGARAFSEGLAPVKVSGKWGYVDKNGRVVVECKYEYAGILVDGRGLIESDEKWGFIDPTGKVVIEPKFPDATSFREGLAGVTLEADGKIGFIDRDGKVVIQPKFDFISRFKEGLAAAQETDGKPYGYIDKTGKWAIQPKFDNAEDFCEGLARVEIKEKYGFIDKTGKFVIEAKLKYVGNFSGGLATRLADGVYGYIDRTGQWAIPPRFGYAEDFKPAGITRVVLYGLDGYIDKRGKLLYDPLTGIRQWADLDRASRSTGLGGVFTPIRMPSRDAAEAYLGKLHDAKKRPVSFKFDGVRTSLGRSLTRYVLTDKDGEEDTLYFDLSDNRVEADKVKSPGRFFFLKAAGTPPTRAARAPGKYQCVCGYVYDPAKGDPDHNVEPDTAFEDLPEKWVCPGCGLDKTMFDKLYEPK